MLSSKQMKMSIGQLDAEISRIGKQTRKTAEEIMWRDSDGYSKLQKTRKIKAYRKKQKGRIDELKERRKHLQFLNKHKTKCGAIPKTRAQFISNVNKCGVMAYMVETYRQYVSLMRVAQLALDPFDTYTFQVAALVNDNGRVVRKSLKIDDMAYPVHSILSEPLFDSILGDAISVNIDRSEDFLNSTENFRGAKYRLDGVLVSFRGKALRRPSTRGMRNRTPAIIADNGRREIYAEEM